MSLGRLERLIAGIALLAVLVPLSPVAANVPRAAQIDPPPARLGSPEVFGYLTYWDLNALLDYSALTTIAYFGIGATADGHLNKYMPGGGVQVEWSRWQGSRVNQVISEAHANGVRFVLTIERFAWTDAGKEATRALLNNPTARQMLAAEIAAEVFNRGIDGVSLDFEPILGDTVDQFGLFLGELRAALDVYNPAYQITFATTGSQRSTALAMYGQAFAAGSADALIIMGYPLRDLDHNIAGGLAPFTATDSYDIKQVVNTYLTPTYAIAPGNIILALPWYGRDWPTETDAENARVQQNEELYDRPRNIGYLNSINLAIANGRRYDQTEQSAWAAYRTRFCLDCPETWSEAYYEDVQSLAFKYDWAVIEKGLAGVGIFAMGYDNDRPEFLSLLRLKFGGMVDGTPPTGSFALAANETMCTAPRVRLAFSLSDGTGGSGPVYIRLSNASTKGSDGLLSAAMTYPATTEIPFQLDNPATGGSNATGNRTVYAQWRDVAGNWSPVSSKSLSVANFAPTAALTVAGGANVVSTPSIAVKVVRSAGRSLAKLRLSSSSVVGSDGRLTNGRDFDPGSNGNFNVTYSLIDPTTGGADVEGRRTVYAQWRDSAGCWSAPVFGRVTLDRTAPTGTVSVVGAPTLSTTGALDVLAPATDALSGVAEMALSNDGTTWTSFAPTANPVAWNAGATADGPWTIRAKWRDGVGNWSAPQTTSLTLDRRGPAGTLLLNGGAPATALGTVTLTAPATDASGVAEVLISNSPTTVGGVLSGATTFAPSPNVQWQLAGTGTPIVVPEGTATVYAQWRDGVGNWSAIVAATIVVDRSAPTVSTPQPSLPKGVQLGTTVPVTATWTSTDALTGVVGERVQLAPAGSPWSFNAAFGSSPQPGAVDVISAWQYSVSATDAAGNSSLPVASAPFRAQLFQENDAKVTYSGRWTVASNSAASGGATRYATAQGATATLTFTGRAAAWVAPLGLKKGKAKVFVDGVLAATVDLKATARQRVLVFTTSWATSGAHTLSVKVLATTYRPRIDVDAFAVLY